MPRLRFLAFLAALLPTVALATDVAGTLPGNTTWSPAGNPYHLTGDLTVPAGVTLTLQPGVVVTFAGTDGAASGINTSEAELIVGGTLLSQGTGASPVSLTATGAYGVRVLAGATATLDATTLSGGLFTLTSGGTTTLNDSTVQGGTTECVRVSDGAFTFTRGTLTGCAIALNAVGGRSNVTHSLVRASGSTATFSPAIQLSATASFQQNTISANNHGAVRINSFAGSTTFIDNIIISNGEYGLSYASASISSPAREVHHNLVWNHESDHVNVAAGAGSLSARPLLVSATNHRLTENSPARMAGWNGTDLGAFPYAGDPTPTLQGVLYTDRTLSGANTLAGDLTVRSGVKLTLAPGSSLTFSTSDGSGTGADYSRTELIIDGTLVSQGTSAAPVSITATNAYGVLVRNGGLASFDYTTLSGGYYTLASNGLTFLTQSTVQNGTWECVRVGGGTFSFTQGTLTGCPLALNALGGNTTLTHSLVKASGFAGISQEAIQLSASATLVHNTLTGNNFGAVRVNTFTGTVKVVDNVISSNGTYSVNFKGLSPTREVHHNLLWGHALNSTGEFDRNSPVGNPLFVGGANYRLTENSPARMAASDGTDLGAFPYAGDPTATLQGILYTDRTLSGANTLAGDLTVRPGVKLTLAAGSSLTFAASDAFGSGTDASKTELIVGGTLLSQGTAAAPISLTATGAYGVRVLAGATATLDHTTLSGGLFTLTSDGATTVSNSTVQNGTTECVHVGAGTFDFTRGTLTGCTVALSTFGGSTTVTSSLVRANGSADLPGSALQLRANTRLVRNTITGNTRSAVLIFDFSGSATITDNIISSNGPYGLEFLSSTWPTRTVSHNLLWGHTTNSVKTGPTVGIVTGNPLFVGGANYRLTENSPARMAASDGTDLGAFPYAGDPTTTLQGILYTDKTLNGASTLVGDLTVRPGVKLTLAAGSSLTFAPTDAFGAGFQPTKTELIVQGTLLSQGTGALPVGITATNAYGVTVEAGGTASIEHTTLSGGDTTFSNIGGTSTLSHSTVQGGGVSTCVRVGGGTFDFTRGTLTGCPLAVQATGGHTRITYSLMKASGSSSRFNEAIQLHAPADLVHNTFTGNSYGAVRVYGYSSPGAVNILDNIITSNGASGLLFNSATSPARSVHHNDVWGHTTNYTNVSAGAGSISANPLFVSATDYSLQESSPCRRLASDGTDLGAFPYTPPVPARVVVLPLSASLPWKGTQQFTATAYDAASNPIPNRPVTWSASGAAGTISPTGLFTASCTPGAYPGAVKATIDGRSATADVTVTASSGVASVVLSPPSASVAINGAQQFTATSADACGNPVSSPISWAVVNGGGTITASGLFTAGSATGTFTNTVRASSGAVSTTATVTVTGGPLASIEVSPSTRTLPIHGTQQFIAVGRDAAGNVVPVTPTWSVVGGGGTIDTGGRFTAGTVPGTYANTVQATSGDITARATVTVQAGPLASLQVTPSTQTLSIHGVQRFIATGKDSAGNTVSVTPTWSVVQGGGTIAADGTFTAGTTPGTFTNTVRATSGSISGFASVTVQPGALASIEVTPATATLSIQGTRQFSARGKDSAGNTVPVSVTWSVVQGGGTIDAAGMFTAGTRPGTYANTIQATGGGFSGFASVTVQPGALASLEVTPGSSTLSIHGTQRFTATGKDSAGNVVSTSVTWSVVKGGGTLAADGTFTAGTTPGTYSGTVKATSGSVSGLATVIVVPGALASLEVTPQPVTLAIHGVQKFSATGKDSAGNTVPASVTWSVVKGGGSIAADGTFTAGTTPGTYTETVKAMSGSVSGFASVTVKAGNLASIVVTPGEKTLPIHGTQQFTASGKDSAGNPVPVTVTWSVEQGGGTVAADGTFTAGTRPGRYANTVKATSDGISGFATVTVEAGALASIEVTPGSVSLPLRGEQTFTATGRDSAGNPVPVSVLWSVEQGGGTLSAAGTFTAGTKAGTFTHTVKATSGSLSGFASVTVLAGALASIEVAPSEVALAIHEARQFTATGRDSAGNVIPVSVTWSVEAEGGTIDTAGLFTAGTVPGTYTNTVKATANGRSGFASVTVTPGALASLELTPDAAILSVQGTRRFTVTGRDAAGNPVPASVTWSVVRGGGTIDASGLFTAGTVAGTYLNTVQAQAGTLSATASITVEPGPVHAVAVAPAAVTLGVRGTRRFTATATDAFGNGVSGTLAWSVQPEHVGTIASDGTFTAGRTAGDYAAAVTATLAGVSGSADVTLLPGALARVRVTPAALSLEPRSTRQFSARGEDADGNPVAITPVWSVTDGAGSITPEGLFTSTRLPGSYPDSVQAIAESVVGTASLTVVPGGVHRVVLSPLEPTVAIHGTVSFSAKAFDAFDNEVGPLTPTWEVLRGGGTIDARGVFTADAESGSYADTVKVTLGGGSATTSVTVAADFDGDGMPDAWELANGFDPKTAGDASLDTDGDAVANGAEFELGTNPRDADTDEDGVLDGREQKAGEDADGDGLANVKDADSDNDGLSDGTEMAITAAHADTDVSLGRFVADADPLSSTGPLTADTDGDGREDGEEDANHDGKVDSGETDPNVAELFCTANPQCGGGQVCGDKGVCVPSPESPEAPQVADKGGGGCSGAGAGTSVFGLLLLALLGRVGGRRRA